MTQLEPAKHRMNDCSEQSSLSWNFTIFGESLTQAHDDTSHFETCSNAHIYNSLPVKGTNTRAIGIVKGLAVC